jgi:hypothetical protein
LSLEERQTVALDRIAGSLEQIVTLAQNGWFGGGLSQAEGESLASSAGALDVVADRMPR